MADFSPDPARFNAFLSAAATRIETELRQDSNVALDVDRTALTVRGLLDMESGKPTWMPWPIDWSRMYRDGPEAVAYDFVETLRQRRREQAVLRALASPKYDWRTLDGIAKESGLPPDEVQRTLARLADDVIQSTVPDPQGRALFSTRERYRATHNAVVRLGNIFRAG